jgi:ribosomal subunit interface protein
MAIQITGKNLDLGSSLRGYVTDRLEKAFEKYGTDGLSGHIFVEKEHGRFATQCSVHLRSGLSLQSQGQGNEAYASVDEAMDRLEKRLRRYKRRLKNHHGGGRENGSDVEMTAIDYTLRQDDDEDEVSETELAPAIIAETQMAVRELSVGDAVMQMDLAEKAFVIFKNASNGRVNVVYRREDGHIGWIDPGGLSTPKKERRG